MLRIDLADDGTSWLFPKERNLPSTCSHASRIRALLCLIFLGSRVLPRFHPKQTEHFYSEEAEVVVVGRESCAIPILQFT